MKSEKGITLISIIIYLIAMSIVVALVANLTGYFYNNININLEKDDINIQYTKFNSFFLEEVNKSNNKIIEVNTDNPDMPYVVFSSKNQYTFIRENKSIYRNNVEIASNIEDCIFTQNTKGGKIVIEVTIKSSNFERTATYTLRN